MDRINRGKGDAFVAKYDSAGGLVWLRQIGSTNFDGSDDVAVDTVGNVYIAGITRGNLGEKNYGECDAFVAKYDADGNLKWTRQIGTSGFDFENGFTLDTAGNVYLCGQTDGDFGETKSGREDMFVVKIDTAGKLIWSRQVGSTDFDSGAGIAVDNNKNVYATGRTGGNLGGTNFGGWADAFVIKFQMVSRPGLEAH